MFEYKQLEEKMKINYKDLLFLSATMILIGIAVGINLPKPFPTQLHLIATIVCLWGAGECVHGKFFVLLDKLRAQNK